MLLEAIERTHNVDVCSLNFAGFTNRDLPIGIFDFFLRFFCLTKMNKVQCVIYLLFLLIAILAERLAAAVDVGAINFNLIQLAAGVVSLIFTWSQ